MIENADKLARQLLDLMMGLVVGAVFLYFFIMVLVRLYRLYRDFFRKLWSGEDPWK